MPTQEPEVGWGILHPDPELTPETVAALTALESLSPGQRDAILARCVDRYLSCTMGINGDYTSAEMVECTSVLSNVFLDMLGKP